MHLALSNNWGNLYQIWIRNFQLNKAPENNVQVVYLLQLLVSLRLI